MSCDDGHRGGGPSGAPRKVGVRPRLALPWRSLYARWVRVLPGHSRVHRSCQRCTTAASGVHQAPAPSGSLRNRGRLVPAFGEVGSTSPQDPTDRHPRSPLESFLTARSSREAHLSAQGPSPLPQARLPSSDVGPRRAGHHQGPSPQGPSSSVGLRRRTRRSTGSPNVPSSPSSAAPVHGVDMDRCTSSASSVSTQDDQRSRTQSHGEWATRSPGTGYADGCASQLDPFGLKGNCQWAPIWSSQGPTRPRSR